MTPPDATHDVAPTPRVAACLRDAPRHILAEPGQVILVTPAPQLLDLAKQLERELAGMREMIGNLHETCREYEARLQARDDAARSEIRAPDEGYPGIAHDLESLRAAARIIRDAFTYDPGHSDLDDEQPIHISTTLGAWRGLHRAIYVSAGVVSRAQQAVPSAIEQPVSLKVRDGCLWLDWREGMLNLTDLVGRNSEYARRDMTKLMESLK